MREFFRNKRLVAVIALALVLILLVFILGPAFNLTSVDKAFSAIFSPVESAFSFVFGGIGDLVSGIFSPDQTKQENEQLKQQVANLQQQENERGELEQENARLQAMLGYQHAHRDMQFVFAEVTGKNPGYWFDTFTINAGSRDGLKQNMTVVTADGLVGKLSEVGGTWSRVVTIVDSSSSVSGIMTRTREHGIVRGTALKGDPCQMVYLPAEADIKAGDLVSTSGLDGMMPAGISIGKVRSVSKSQDQTQQIAVIDPSVDLQRISEVMVITNTQELIDGSGVQVDAQQPDDSPTPDASIAPSPSPGASPGASATPRISGALSPSPSTTPARSAQRTEGTQ